MKLEKMAAFAEIVSSIAIVATLGYLAIQSQQTTTALFANSRATTMTADVNLLLAGYDPVGGDQGRFIAAFFQIRQFAWFQYESGILDQAAWESYIAPLANGMMDAPEVSSWWEANSSQLAPGFVAAINQAAGRD
jgi:hypothetical protein